MINILILILIFLFIIGILIVLHEVGRQFLPEEDPINNYYGFLNDKYAEEEEELKDYYESLQEN